MTTDIVLYQEMPLAERTSYAHTIARAATLLPNGLRAGNADETAARAFLIMETGAMLGLHPIAALSSVNIIEGKPAMSADLMVATVRAAGHKVSIREEGSVESGDYKAIVTLTRSDDPENPTVSTWTPHRAARAGLCRYEEQGGVWKVTARSQQDRALPWENYTEALCKARAKSEAMRDGGSDVLNGVRYTPEELGAEVDASGEVVGTITAASEEPAAPSALPPAAKRAAKGTQGTKRATAAVTRVEETPAAPEEPQESAEEVEAEIVDDEPPAVSEAPSEPQEAPTLMPDAPGSARAEDAQDGESEVDYQWRKAREREAAERQAEIAATEIVATGSGPKGEVTITREQEDAQIKARLEEKRAARAAAESAPVADGEPDAFTAALIEEPENFARQIELADTLEQAKSVWDRATAAGAMTSELRLAVVKRKAKIESAANPAPEEG